MLDWISTDMESFAVSMVPDTDPRYREARQEKAARRRNLLWGQQELEQQASGAARLLEYEAIIARTREEELRTRALLANPPAGTNVGVLQAYLQKLKEDRALFQKFHYEEKYRLENLVRRLVADTVFEGETDPSGDRAPFLRREVAAMFLAPEVREETRQQFGGDLQGFTLQVLLRRLEDPRSPLPSEFLSRVVRAHQERMKARQERAERILEEVKAEFLQAVEREVKRGDFPIDTETVRARLSAVGPSLRDRLLEPFSRSMGSHGHDGVVSFYSDGLEDGQRASLRETIFHELTHEIAGKSLQLVPETDADVPTLRPYERKAGVQMSSDSRMELVRRFTWLNEAITEWCALRLAGSKTQETPSPDAAPSAAYKGSSAYVDERKELDRLFALGLPEKLVLEAYFENIRSDQPANQRGLAFAALLRKIRDLEKDPKAFARLDHRFALAEASAFLGGQGVYGTDRFGAEREARLPPGTRLYPINVSIGIQPATRATKTFVYVLRPGRNGDAATSAPPDPLEAILSTLKWKAGGERCRYEVGTPRTI